MTVKPGCNAPPQPWPWPPPAWAAAPRRSTELRVGLIPSEDALAMMRASQQVMDQLAAKTGMKVQPFVANDYNGVIEAMRSGKIDVAYFGPFSYVLASQMANANLCDSGDFEDRPKARTTASSSPRRTRA